MIHGGYKVDQGNKKMGCAELALGVALIAGGYFYQEHWVEIQSEKYFESLKQIFDKGNFGNREIDEKIRDLGQKIEELRPVQECNLTKLLNPIKEVEGDRKTIFDLLNNTRGITCDNFLPWEKSFHHNGNYVGNYMDGIRPEHLKESVMWGVDDLKRFFVAMKAKCSGSPYEKVALMFQRYAHDPKYMIGAGHFRDSRSCFPWAAELTAYKGWTNRLVELFTNNTTRFVGHLESISLA